MIPLRLSLVTRVPRPPFIFGGLVDSPKCQYLVVLMPWLQNAIEYWGNAFDDHGPCDIYLDESYVDTITTYSATRTNPRLLFSRDNLALGDHTLTITVKASSDPNVCEVDRFVYG